MAKQVMTLRVEPEDRLRYEKAAKEAGMSLGEWIRSCCDDCLVEKATPRMIEMAKEAREQHRAGLTAPLDEALHVRAVDPMGPKFVRKPVGKIAKMMEKK